MADQVRHADLCFEEGDAAAGTRALESAVKTLTMQGEQMPPWLVGRLAIAYRSQKRHHDEVDLLERHLEIDSSDGRGARFAARLTKARAVADRARKAESGALWAAKEIRARTKSRRPTPGPVQTEGEPTPSHQSQPSLR